MGQIKYFTLNELQPIGNGYDLQAYIMEANTSLLAGQAVAQVTAASRSEIQTITAPGSGTMKFSFLGMVTAALAFGASDATIQAALRALPSINGANVSVASKVVTFTGTLANNPQPLITSDTATVVRTQGGRKQYGLAAYSGAVLGPLAAPTVTETGTGSWSAGDHEFAVTQVSATGESLPSPATIVAAAGSKKFRVAAITSLDPSVTTVNLYIDGMFAKALAVTSNATAQTDLDVADVTANGYPAPRTATAYSAGDGTQTLLGFAKHDAITDQYGSIWPAQVIGDANQIIRSLPVYVKGRFNGADLSGVDAAGLSGRGVLEAAPLATGIVRLF